MTGTSRFSAWLWPVGAFIAVFAVGLRLHTQGFNLLDDGLWVLGARVIADGDLLYRDLFSIYGPARYFFLLPFFLAFGKSVLGLAVAKAAGDGLAAVVGMWGVRRLGVGRWAWLVPLGVIVLAPIQPRYVAAMVLAVLAADTLMRGLDQRRGILLGLLWGVLSLFGLDMTGYGGVILGMAFLADRRWSSPEGGDLAGRTWLNVLLGWAGILAVTAVLALVLGVARDAVWDTIIYPITRFRGGMGLSWWSEFGDSTKLGETFATLYTGETLGQVWPGQIRQRVLGLRVLYALIWIVPPLGTWLIVRGRKAAWAPVAGLAVAGWATLIGRGDVNHLTLAWCGSLLLIPLILKELSARNRPLAAATAIVVLGAWWPTGMENIWLATHIGRSTLAHWDRPTARIKLDAKRIGGLEELLGFVPTDPKNPQLTWPVQPGLTFLQGAALATAQTTLLAGEVRDPRRVIADLERTRPPAIIQGRAGGLVPGVRTFRGLAPGIYPYIRTHYAAVGIFTLDRETYQILARQDDGPRVIPDMELKYQLPGTEQLVQEAYAAGRRRRPDRPDPTHLRERLPRPRASADRAGALSAHRAGEADHPGGPARGEFRGEGYRGVPGGSGKPGGEQGVPFRSHPRHGGQGHGLRRVGAGFGRGAVSVGLGSSGRPRGPRDGLLSGWRGPGGRPARRRGPVLHGLLTRVLSECSPGTAAAFPDPCPGVCPAASPRPNAPPCRFPNPGAAPAGSAPPGPRGSTDRDTRRGRRRGRTGTTDHAPRRG